MKQLNCDNCDLDPVILNHVSDYSPDELRRLAMRFSRLSKQLKLRALKIDAARTPLQPLELPPNLFLFRGLF